MYVMKVRKITNRGTSINVVDVEKQNWAGDSFRELQQNKLKNIEKNITMHLGRGIRTIKLDNLPSPRPRLSTRGRIRTTNRGTGSRKSINDGS
jgi:hypothetical protein